MVMPASLRDPRKVTSRSPTSKCAEARLKSSGPAGQRLRKLSRRDAPAVGVAFRRLGEPALPGGCGVGRGSGVARPPQPAACRPLDVLRQLVVAALAMLVHGRLLS